MPDNSVGNSESGVVAPHVPCCCISCYPCAPPLCPCSFIYDATMPSICMSCQLSTGLQSFAHLLATSCAMLLHLSVDAPCYRILTSCTPLIDSNSYLIVLFCSLIQFTSTTTTTSTTSTTTPQLVCLGCVDGKSVM